MKELLGLRVAFLSGTYHSEVYYQPATPQDTQRRRSQYAPHYTEHDVNVLLRAPREGYESGVDVCEILFVAPLLLFLLLQFSTFYLHSSNQL